MHRDVSSRPAGHLTPVSLPPLPARGPGAAHRQLSAVSRPPTPPPRPESSLVAPPPPPSSGPAQPSPGAGRVPPSSSDIALQLPAALSSLEPAPAPITLTSPRSHGARTQNLYVDTPFKGAAAAPGGKLRSSSSQSLSSAVKARPRPPPHPLPPPHSASVITTPPFSAAALHHAADPKTSPGAEKLAAASSGAAAATDSIICVVCGRCRCAACGTAAALPSRWLCDNSCLCSATAVVDTLSCMCCVKGAFYHCGERMAEDADKEDSWVDSPCSCHNNKWWLRWGCLALLSVPLPCLLCYPVLKGGQRAAEACYQAATSRGCRCPAPPPASPASPAPSVSAVTSSSPAHSSLLSSPTDSHKRLLG